MTGDDVIPVSIQQQVPFSGLATTQRVIYSIHRFLQSVFMNRTDQVALMLSGLLVAGILLVINWDGWRTRDGRSAEQQNIHPGERVFQDQGCNACHSVDGSPNTGPTMQGLFDTERRMQDGTRIQVDERYVRRSIRYPGKQIVKGYPDNMPSYDHLSDQKVNRLVAYLKRLSEQKHNGS